jgi:hypothetical protein
MQPETGGLRVTPKSRFWHQSSFWGNCSPFWRGPALAGFLMPAGSYYAGGPRKPGKSSAGAERLQAQEVLGHAVLADVVVAWFFPLEALFMIFM